jgi:hypothetical protein
VLSRLFRRLFLERLEAAHRDGRLTFFGKQAALADSAAFDATLKPLRKIDWVVYAKRPFAGPDAVLAYLSRYTHRVAISNSRLIRIDDNAVTFKVKDYRREGPDRHKTMTLATAEFIRRFLIHVLPKGLHRIRHYGLFANGNRVANIARARQLLDAPPPAATADGEAVAELDQDTSAQPCPHCGGVMIVVEVFEAGCLPQYRPTPEAIDSS